MRRGSIVGASVVAVLAFGALQPAAGTAAASTKASSTSSSELANPHGRAAFKAGAAVESITPPRFGAVRDDRADCKPGSLDPRTFDGPRTFAFEEPYIDQANVGTYQLGDPFLDCNGNGRWDGILLGGGSDAPRFATTVADQVTARALVVSN
ncbi:MAG TPA: hypothetical protein VIJ48_07735, partial [Acidimicrobiia bacterium]